MRKQAPTQQKSVMKPMIRVAHGKPTFGSSFSKANGNITPPSDPPAAAIPVALPRFCRKKWLTAAKAGVKIKDVPRPPSTPKTRKKCQYNVHKPSRKLDRQIRMLPASTRSRGPWASKMGPICSPQKNDRKTYMLKIHETVDSE